jgi:hypothetical protein
MPRNLSLLFCVLLFAPYMFCQTMSANAPKAQVTFYSSGSLLKAAIPGYKYGGFSGRIFDEYDQLAMIRLGDFITFSLDPGPHTFSANAWVSPSPKGGGHLIVDLVANQHYFIGAYTETTPLLVLSTFRLEQRTCQQAVDDNRNTKPLDPKHLKKYGQANLIVETSFPQCTVTGHP